jgi:hypothetical protein
VLTMRRCWLALIFAAGRSWIIGGERVSIHARVPENHFIDALGGLSFAIAAVIAADRRPGNALGPLMFGSAASPTGWPRCAACSAWIARPPGGGTLVRAEIPCDG